MRSFLFIIATCLLVAGCASHYVFDTFAPKDAASQRIAKNVSYGPLPRHKLNIYAPRNGAEGLPVLVFTHGGSWKDGNKDLYDFAGRGLAAKGYVTIIPDYGKLPEVDFPAFLQDGAKAAKWVSENIAAYGGNPERFFLVGHSAGAYNSVMLATDGRYLETEGVDPSLIDAVVGMSGPYDFYPFTLKITQEVFGSVSDAATVTQPISYVSSDTPPMFLLIGEKDTLVEPRNIATLSRKLVDAGVRVETKTYERLNHIGPVLGLSRPYRGRSTVLDDIDQFLRSVE